MALFAPRPIISYPFPSIPDMMPPEPSRRRSTAGASFASSSPELRGSSGSEHEPRDHTTYASPKRPRLSTPSGHRSLLMDEPGPSTSTTYPSMLHRNTLEPSLSAPPVQLPSFSSILGRDGGQGLGTTSDGIDLDEFGGARERLRRLAIGPSSFRRPLPHGDVEQSNLAWQKGAVGDDRAPPQSAPLVHSQSLYEIPRTELQSPPRATPDERRRKRHGRGVEEFVSRDRPSAEHQAVSRAPMSLPPMHPDTPRATVPPPSRTFGSHSRQTSLVPPSEAWFSPAAPPSAWTRDNWEQEEQVAYKLGFDDAMRSVEMGIVGVMGQQYRNPTLVKREIPPAQAPGPSSSRTISPSRPPALSQYSVQRPHTAQLPGRDVHWPHQMDQHGHRVSPESGSSIPRHIGFPPAHRPSQSLTREYTLPSLNQLGSFSFSPESTSPNRHSIPSSLSTSSPSGESTTTLPRGPGPGRGHRQSISCYPCRAKKLKCDGVKPCSQCVRRKEVGNCAFAELIKRRGKARTKDDEGSGSQSQSPLASGSKRLWDTTVPKVEMEGEIDMVDGDGRGVDGQSSFADQRQMR